MELSAVADAAAVTGASTDLDLVLFNADISPDVAKELLAAVRARTSPPPSSRSSATSSTAPASTT